MTDLDLDHASTTGQRAHRVDTTQTIRADSGPLAVGHVDRIGRFAVLRLLGEGGMGRVFVAYDEELDRKVAIKLIRDSHRQSATDQARLMREARALARLSHPNVVQVHEAGAHGDSVFVAMELVGGETLSSWLAASAGRWDPILAMMIQAGRGLAAAHHAGVIHRDFKPDNVLVGADGRVRVLDFGLARGFDKQCELEPMLEDEPRVEASTTFTSHARDSFDAALTVRGAVMGTPAYMAPEQHEGQPCDAFADQYAFCVSAYEALFGERPFTQRPISAMAAAKRGAQLRTIPRDSSVPRLVREAILRGLSPAPTDRWPDMDTLLARLESARTTRSRWLAPMTGALLLGGFAAVSLLGRPTAGPEPCQIDRSALVGVWDAERREHIREAFHASEHDFAPQTFDQVERALERWADEWVDAQVAACQATRVQATQSETMLDRRTACFARRRAEAGALTATLANADLTTVARTREVLAELPDLGACSLASLEAESGVGLEAASAEQRSAHEQLARARIELRVGRPERAVTIAEELFAQATDEASRTLAFEAQAVLALVSIGKGELEAGARQLRAIADEAERARALDTAASMRVELARALAGDFANPLLEQWMIDDAALALSRVARVDDRREVTLEVARARLVEQAGRYDDAVEAHERAYLLAEGRMEDGERTLLRMGVATALYRGGQLDAARDELAQILDSARVTWGAGSPQVARVEFDAGLVATDLGEFERARGHLERAIEIDARVWGEDSLALAQDRFAAASLAFGLGEIERGCATVEQVLLVYVRELGPDHDETADTQTALAVCHYLAGELERALAGFERALATKRAILGEGHVDLGMLYANIAEGRLELGELELARQAADRAQAIYAAELPDGHPWFAQLYLIQGKLLLASDDAQRASSVLELALALADEAQPVELADVSFALARALVVEDSRTNRERARQLARDAAQGYARAEMEEQAATARAWLLEHPAHE